MAHRPEDQPGLRGVRFPAYRSRHRVRGLGRSRCPLQLSALPGSRGQAAFEDELLDARVDVAECRFGLLETTAKHAVVVQDCLLVQLTPLVRVGGCDRVEDDGDIFDLIASTDKTWINVSGLQLLLDYNGPFDPAHVGPVDSALEGEFLLRPALSFSGLP